MYVQEDMPIVKPGRLAFLCHLSQKHHAGKELTPEAEDHGKEDFEG